MLLELLELLFQFGPEQLCLLPLLAIPAISLVATGAAGGAVAGGAIAGGALAGGALAGGALAGTTATGLGVGTLGAGGLGSFGAGAAGAGGFGLGQAGALGASVLPETLGAGALASAPASQVVGSVAEAIAVPQIAGGATGDLALGAIPELGITEGAVFGAESPGLFGGGGATQQLGTSGANIAPDITLTEAKDLFDVGQKLVDLAPEPPEEEQNVRREVKPQGRPSTFNQNQLAQARTPEEAMQILRALLFGQTVPRQQNVLV